MQDLFKDRLMCINPKNLSTMATPSDILATIGMYNAGSSLKILPGYVVGYRIQV